MIPAHRERALRSGNGALGSTGRRQLLESARYDLISVALRRWTKHIHVVKVCVSSHIEGIRTFVITSAFLLTSAFTQAAPRIWHFTCDYYNLDVKGNLAGRQRYSASYTRGLPGDVVRWSDDTVANAKGWSDDFGPAQKQHFMEGFSYALAEVANMTKPDFFRGFPPTSPGGHRRFIDRRASAHDREYNDSGLSSTTP